MPDFDQLHELARKLAALTEPGKREEDLITWCQWTGKTWMQIAAMWDEKLNAGASQAEVQLAGCLTAAEGWAGSDPPKQGDWAWSPAFQAVMELREIRDLLCINLEHAANELAARNRTSGPLAPTPPSFIIQLRNAVTRARGKR
jgi:hypothetical protein